MTDRNSPLGRYISTVVKVPAPMMFHPIIYQGIAHLDFSELNLEDGAATFTAFTAHSIARAAHWFDEPVKKWVICGGGRHNATLMNMLREILPNVKSAEEENLNGDSMEAEAWAYLAVRSLLKLPITFPGTTGVKVEMTGGILAKAT